MAQGNLVSQKIFFFGAEGQLSAILGAAKRHQLISLNARSLLRELCHNPRNFASQAICTKLPMPKLIHPEITIPHITALIFPFP